jgi:hypothetical protein
MAGYGKRKAGQLAGSAHDTPNLTQVDHELMSLGSKLKNHLDNQIDAAVPGVKAERREWGKVRDLERSVDNLIRNPRAAFSNLKNAGVDSNLTNRQLFNRVDRLIGTDLAERAKIATAAELTGPGRKSLAV